MKLPLKHTTELVYKVVHVYGWTDGEINEQIQVYRYFLEENREIR